MSSASKTYETIAAQRPPGLFGRPVRAIQRNKLACVVSAFLAVLFVTMIGFFCIMFWQLLAMMLDKDVYELNQSLGIKDRAPFFGGVATAVFLSSFNWYLSMIIIPVAIIVISQVTGRLPHRGISSFAPYFWQTGITGAVLVGGTCFMTLVIVQAFNSLPGISTANAIFTAAGALLMGSLIGLAAGLGVGVIHYLIVRPKAQLELAGLKTADVFE